MLDIMGCIDPLGTVNDWGPMAVQPPATLMLFGASVGLPLIGVGLYQSVAAFAPVLEVHEEMSVIWMGSMFVFVKLKVTMLDPLFWVVLHVITTWAELLSTNRSSVKAAVTVRVSVVNCRFMGWGGSIGVSGAGFEGVRSFSRWCRHFVHGTKGLSAGEQGTSRMCVRFWSSK
jgi:hypothetical protein